MAQIQDNLTKASVFGINIGDIGDHIANLGGLLGPTQDDYYDDNDLYHATFTADGGTYTDKEKQRVSTFIQQLGLTSNSGFKPRITVKKVKRNGESGIIYGRTDGINNHSAVQQAAQSFINDVADQYNQGWAYEINISNDGMLSEERKVQQEATTHAYKSALQGNYFDGTQISDASFRKYKNKDGFFDLQSFLKDSFNAQIASENGKVTRKALVANVGGDAVWENLVKRSYMEEHDGSVSSLDKGLLGTMNTVLPFYNYTEDTIGGGLIGSIAKFLKFGDYDEHLLSITNNGKDVNALMDILSDENYWNNDSVGSFARGAAQFAPDALLALGTAGTAALGKTAVVQGVKQGVESGIKNNIRESIANKLITAGNFGIGAAKKTAIAGFIADDAAVNFNHELAKMQTGEGSISSLLGAGVQLGLPIVGFDFASRGLGTLKKLDIIKNDITTNKLSGILTHHLINSGMYTMIDAGATAAQGRDINWGEYLLMGGIELATGTAISKRTLDTRVKNEELLNESAKVVQNIVLEDLAGGNKSVSYTLDETELMSSDLRREQYRNTKNLFDEFRKIEEEVKEIQKLNPETNEGKEDKKTILKQLERKQMDIFSVAHERQDNEWKEFFEKIPEAMRKEYQQRKELEETVRARIENKRKLEKELVKKQQEFELDYNELYEKLDENVKKEFTKEEFIKAKNGTDAVLLVENAIKEGLYIKGKKIEENSKEAKILLSQARVLQSPESRMVLNRLYDSGILGIEKEFQEETISSSIDNFIYGLGSYDNLSKEDKAIYNKFMQYSIMKNIYDKSYRDELKTEANRERIIEEEFAESQRKGFAVSRQEIRDIANILISDRHKAFTDIKKDITSILDNNPERFKEFLEEKDFPQEKFNEDIAKLNAAITGSEHIIASSYESDKYKNELSQIKKFEEFQKKFNTTINRIKSKNLSDDELQFIKTEVSQIRVYLNFVKSQRDNPIPQKDINTLMQIIDIADKYTKNVSSESLKNKEVSFEDFLSKELGKVHTKYEKEVEKEKKIKDNLEKLIEKEKEKLETSYDEYNDIVEDIKHIDYKRMEDVLNNGFYQIIDDEKTSLTNQISNLFIKAQQRKNENFLYEQKEMNAIKNMDIDEFVEKYSDIIDNIIESGRTDLTDLEKQIINIYNQNKEDFILTKEINSMSESEFIKFSSSENGMKIIDSIEWKINRKEKITKAEKKLYDLYNGGIFEKYEQEKQIFKEGIPKNANPTKISGDIITTVNPTGTIFTEYTPEKRVNSILSNKLVTLTESKGENPNNTITIYRGTTKGQKSINPGDFVTTNKQLAQDYAGDGVVISKTVKLKDIIDERDEPLGEEYLYIPSEKQKWIDEMLPEYDIDLSYKGHFDFAIELYKILHTPSVKNRLKAKTISKGADGVILDIDNLPLKSPIRKIKKRTIEDTIDAMMESPSNLMIGLRHFISIGKNSIKPDKLEKLIELRDFGLQNMKAYDWDVVKDYFYDRLAVGAKFNPVPVPKIKKATIKKKNNATIDDEIKTRKEKIENAKHNNTRDSEQMGISRNKNKRIKSDGKNIIVLKNKEKEINTLEESLKQSIDELNSIPEKLAHIEMKFYVLKEDLGVDLKNQFDSDILKYINLENVNFLNALLDKLIFINQKLKDLRKSSDSTKKQDATDKLLTNEKERGKIEKNKQKKEKLLSKYSELATEFHLKIKEENKKAYEDDLALFRGERNTLLSDLQKQLEDVNNNLSNRKKEIQKKAQDKYAKFVKEQMYAYKILFPGIEKTKGFKQIIKDSEKSMNDVTPQIRKLLSEEYGDMKQFNLDLNTKEHISEFMKRLKTVSGKVEVDLKYKQLLNAKDTIDTMKLESSMQTVNLYQQFRIEGRRMASIYELAIKNGNFIEARRIKEEYLNKIARLEQLVNKYEMGIHTFRREFIEDINQSVKGFVSGLKVKNGLISSTLSYQNLVKYLDDSGKLGEMLERILMPTVTQYELLSNQGKKILNNMKTVLTANGKTEEELFALFLAKNQFNGILNKDGAIPYKSNLVVEVLGNGLFDIKLKSFAEIKNNKDKYVPFTEEYQWLLDKKWVEMNNLTLKGNVSVLGNSRNKMDMSSLIAEWVGYTDTTYNQIYYNSLLKGEIPPKREKYYMPLKTIVYDADGNYIPKGQEDIDAKKYLTGENRQILNKGFTKSRTRGGGKEYQFSSFDDMFKEMQEKIEQSTVRVPLTIIRDSINAEIELQKSLAESMEERENWDKIKTRIIGISSQNMKNSLLGNFIEQRKIDGLEMFISGLTGLLTVRALSFNPLQYLTQKITLISDSIINGNKFSEEANNLAGAIDLGKYSAVISNIESVNEITGRRVGDNSAYNRVQKIVNAGLKTSFITYSDFKVRETLFLQGYISELAKWAEKQGIDFDIGKQAKNAIELGEVIDNKGNKWKIPDLDYQKMIRGGDLRVTSIMSSNILGNNPIMIQGSYFGFGLFMQKTALYEMMSIISKALLERKKGVLGSTAAIGLILTYIALTANISSELNAISSLVYDGVLKYARENNHKLSKTIGLHQNYDNFWEKDSLIYNSLKKYFSGESGVADLGGDAILKGLERLPGVSMFAPNQNGLVTAEAKFISALVSGEIGKSYDYASKIFKIPVVRNALKDLGYEYNQYYKENYDETTTFNDFLKEKDLKHKTDDNKEQYKYLIASSRNWLSQGNIPTLNHMINYKFYTQTEKQKLLSIDDRYRLAITDVFEQLVEKGTIQSANKDMLKHMNVLFSQLKDSQKNSIIKQKEKDIEKLSNESFFIRFGLDSLSSKEVEKRIKSMYDNGMIEEEQYRKLISALGKERKKIIDRQFEFNERDFGTNISYEK